MSYGRGPPEIQGMFSLKVDNLTYRTSPDDLRRAFEKYGDVGDVYIPRDRFSRESRGFAFVRFYDKRDAEDAMDSMDGSMMDGRELRVQMARYGRPVEPHRRGPARRNNRGYNRRSYSRSRSRSTSRSRSRRHRGGGRSRSHSRSRSRSRGSKSRSKSRSRSRSRSKSRSRERSRSRSRSGSKSPREPPKSRSRSKSSDRDRGSPVPPVNGSDSPEN